MTSPRRAESTAKGRYYRHPVTAASMISVTNVISTCVAKPALVPWAAKIAATWAVEQWPALTARMRTDRDGVLADIKSQVTVARDKAADLGSRIHAAAEAHILGHQGIGDPEVAPYLEQYETFLTDWGIDLTQHVHAAELTVADPTRGYAGTLDLLIHLPLDGFIEGQVRYVEPGAPWPLWVVDIKTSATRPRASGYDEYVLQLAALRYARETWLPDDTTAPMPRIAGGAVLNLRKGSYALIPVDASPHAHRAFLAALDVAKWAHTRGSFEPPVDAPGKTRRRKVATPSPRAADQQRATEQNAEVA